MENASKALLMAAGFLMGLLILSLMVYLFVSFGSNAEEMRGQIERDRLAQFNSQFTSYQGKEGITIYDIITAAGFATENNKYYGFNKKTISVNSNYGDYYVAVVLQGKGQIEYGSGDTTDNIQTKYNDLITETLDNMNHSSNPDDSELVQYNCQTYLSEATGRVYLVMFTPK